MERSAPPSAGSSPFASLTRLFYSVVLLVETVALVGIAALIGYLVYRILLGTSNDPRRSS